MSLSGLKVSRNYHVKLLPCAHSRILRSLSYQKMLTLEGGLNSRKEGRGVHVQSTSINKNTPSTVSKTLLPEQMPTLEVSSGALLVVLYGHGIGYEYNKAEGGGERQKPAVWNKGLQVFSCYQALTDSLSFPA